MATAKFLQQLITNPDRLNDLVAEVKEMAFQHGLMMRRLESPNSSEVVTYAPFSLLPSPLPKAMFLQAMAVQTCINTLMDKISQDPDFLEEALAGTIQVDDFTARLFDIYRRVQLEGQTQSIVVGLLRSDYMVDQRQAGTPSLKQVEINTFAVGGFGVSDRLNEVHRYVLKSAGLSEESRSFQKSNKTSGMCAALEKAWELYGQQKAVILFLVEFIEISKLTHRCIEEMLWDRNIPVIRRNFEDVSRRGYLDDDKRFFIDGLEVALVYYRYGYMPDNYSEEFWEARLMMERSLAVKCPDIATHLAGTKKVQQVLARPGVVERFFPGQPRVVEQIRTTFTGLYTLDMGPEGDETVEMALAAPDQFVLKPQREGGGNNIYGLDIVKVLQRLKESPERMAYILMDKLQPKSVRNILVQPNCPIQMCDCISEFGALGAYVRQGEDMVMNECVGHFMRTKNEEHDDGGILAGVTVIDSPLLI